MNYLLPLFVLALSLGLSAQGPEKMGHMRGDRMMGRQGLNRHEQGRMHEHIQGHLMQDQHEHGQIQGQDATVEPKHEQDIQGRMAERIRGDQRVGLGQGRTTQTTRIHHQ